MHSFIQFTGPNNNLQVFGVRFLGVNELNLRKLAFTAALLLFLYLLSAGLRTVAGMITGHRKQKAAFWTGQGVSILTFALGVLGFVSIWFDDPARLATGAGLLGAGLAFALQKVVTSFAGYFVILRGETFNIGDRILMGGVRGDVVSINFIQTVVMEMGQPPGGLDSGSETWVQSRQYTGRIVTIANSTIFDDPVYNYTRDFPYIWEEIQLPIAYRDDRGRAERILLEVAAKETVKISEMAQPALDILRHRFFIEAAEIKPRVYMRLTDNWVELTVRFLCKDHDIRSLKDRMSRAIIDQLQAAGIGIASGTYEIAGLPPVRVETLPSEHPAA
jgi:small-conductance mechanosensitive channel